MYLYGKIWPTTRLLREKLECRAGLRLTTIRKRRLIINWGRHTDFSDCPHVLNRHLITNKYKELEILNREGVNVPEYTRNVDSIRHTMFPVLARKFNHSQGTDIVKYVDDNEFRDECYSHDYFIKYIEKRGEYRVHVLGGEVACITKKKRLESEEQDEVVWSHKKGWQQIQYRREGRYYEGLSDLGIRAVESLGYDFGAVDIIIGKDEARTMYVLEVNSAPGLIDTRADLYVEYFRRVESEIQSR